MGNDENYKRKPRNMGPNRVAEKPKNFKIAIRNLIRYLNKLFPLMIVALILSSFSSILTIIGPNRLSDLTDEITKGLITGMNFDAITSITVFLVVIYLVSQEGRESQCTSKYNRK